MNVQNITLDLSKAIMAGQIVRMGQGDNEGATIHATILDNSTVPSLTGMSARFYMRMPDGIHYVRDVNCTISGNVITYVVDEEHCCAVAGYTDEAYFEVVSGSTEYSTSRFRVKVERAAHDGAVPTESWDNAIEELISRGEQAVDDAEQAVDDATSAVDAANQAIARIEPTIEQAAEDAAEQATADAEQRIQDAIDAVGEISELAVPLMSSDTRGGAKLEAHGGLALRDGSLGIGSLVQQSDGYARGGLAEVTAKVHAEQVATTGKQLFDRSTVTSGYLIASDGTETADADFAVSAAIAVDAGSSYAVSGMGTASAGYAAWYDSSDALVSTDAQSDTDFALTAPSGASKVKLSVPVANLGTTQLELGSTATAYEPYTGGAPSPSPDYPQEIQVVRGRNLIDSDTSKWEVGGINSASGRDGANTARIRLKAANPIEVNSGETYTLSLESAYRIIIIAEYNVSNTFVKSTVPAAMTSTFTTSTTTKYVRIVLAFSNGASIELAELSNIHPQLTLGSTPQPYVPYGHVGMEVRGKNLLDRSTEETGKYRAQQGSVSNQVLMVKSALIPVTQGTYVFHGKSGVELSKLVHGFNSSGTWTSLLVRTSDSVAVGVTYSLSFEVPSSGVSFVELSYGIYDTDVQLELGSTATAYEPYCDSTTPIPLPQRGWVAGLRDGTADSLRLDGAGKCEWTLPMSEVVLDGSENWTTGSTPLTDQLCVFVTCQSIGVYAKIPATFTEIFSTHFRALRAGGGATAGNTNCVSFNASVGNLLINIDKTIAETTPNFIAWLQSNPFTVLYPLATPVTEECGYVDMPAIPSDATVTIPELDAIGIRYFVDDTVTQYGREIYARVRSEYADRLTALEQAVAELATS